MHNMKPIDEVMLLIEHYSISPYTILELMLDHLSGKELADMLEFLYNETSGLKSDDYR